MRNVASLSLLTNMTLKSGKYSSYSSLAKSVHPASKTAEACKLKLGEFLPLYMDIFCHSLPLYALNQVLITIV